MFSALFKQVPFTSRYCLVCHRLNRIYYTTTSADSDITSWKPISPLLSKVNRIPRLLASLTKLKLSSLVVTTTIAGFQLSPLAGNYPLLGWTVIGVALSSFSANVFNQWLEGPFDSQMGRTRSRPLPTHQLSSFFAFNFAVISGMTGMGLLAWQVGGIPALLAGSTILLYAGLYTPLKRLSIVNTWVGAVVGAIPPLIGYVAGGGALMSWGAAGLGGLLYCWQFPHFNSLSWNYRSEYARAGYCMASILNPRLSLNSALRHSLATIPCCVLLVYGGICDNLFLIDSSIVNILLVGLAWKFHRHSERNSARRLFLYSLVHLPVLMALMLLHRQYDSQIDDKDRVKVKDDKEG